MTNMSRQGDTCIHPPCEPHSIAGPCSPNTFVNGIRAARNGLDWTIVHYFCLEPHVGACAGVRNVYVNGRCAQGIGDPCTCGSTIVGGSPNVWVP